MFCTLAVLRFSCDAHALQDATFHQCVNLGTYEANKVVTFVPPDGEFELMRCVGYQFYALRLPSRATSQVPPGLWV